MRAIALLALLSAGCSRQLAACAANVAGQLALAGAATLLEGLAAGGGSVEVGRDQSDDEVLPDLPGLELGPRDSKWVACGGGRRYRLECPGWSKLCYVADSENRLWRCDHAGCWLPQALTDWCHGG